MTILQTCDDIFGKFKLPTELYKEIFKYIPVHSVITKDDSLISMKFYSYKDLFSSCCFLVDNMYYCDNLTCCDNVIQKRSSIMCSNCSYIFCTHCIYVSSCCGIFLCDTCLETCTFCDTIYCQMCIIDGACNNHVNDANQIDSEMSTSIY